MGETTTWLMSLREALEERKRLIEAIEEHRRIAEWRLDEFLPSGGPISDQDVREAERKNDEQLWAALPPRTSPDA